MWQGFHEDCKYHSPEELCAGLRCRHSWLAEGTFLGDAVLFGDGGSVDGLHFIPGVLFKFL